MHCTAVTLGRQPPYPDKGIPFLNERISPLTAACEGGVAGVKGPPLTDPWGEGGWVGGGGGGLACHLDKGLARAGQGLGSTVAVQIALQGHLELLLAGAGQCGGLFSVIGHLAADVWGCHHGCRSRPYLGEGLGGCADGPAQSDWLLTFPATSS
jgi:hypothetical protein